MKILIIGNGCREHAIGWFLSKDRRVKKLWFAVGNAGTEQLGENIAISSSDIDQLCAWAVAEKPDLTVVGPEAPLCAGIVDAFEQKGLKIFGPNKSAARLEGSKLFSKALFVKAGIPTAKSRRFFDSPDAIAYSKTHPFPQVIKADGLASGKGVVIAQNFEEAERAIVNMMDRAAFGEAGRRILIEEFLVGQELSVHAITDGETYRLFPSAHDHKRIFDGDEGPNTGGMGAYAPSPLFTPQLREKVCHTVFDPLLKALKEEGVDYRGVLYAGLMLTNDGLKVLEFNSRFGDPETQVMLPLLDTPLLDILLAVVDKRLKDVDVKIEPNKAALTVVLAAPGYPGQPSLGAEIFGLDSAQKWVFHGGTRMQGNAVVTSSGRVLSVTAVGETARVASDQAYKMIEGICFEKMHYRRDIGARFLTSDR